MFVLNAGFQIHSAGMNCIHTSDPNHPFIEDLKMKDFVFSMPLEEERICGNRFLRDYAAECRKMAPLVEFTTKALELKY